jgi:hypothetical protein
MHLDVLQQLLPVGLDGRLTGPHAQALWWWQEAHMSEALPVYKLCALHDDALLQPAIIETDAMALRLVMIRRRDTGITMKWSCVTLEGAAQAPSP